VRFPIREEKRKEPEGKKSRSEEEGETFRGLVKGNRKRRALPYQKGGKIAEKKVEKRQGT